MSPTRLCNEPRCGNPATARGKCDEHRKTYERDHSRARRADGIKAFYDRKRWKLARRHHLFNNPLCERCGNIAEHVHHDPKLEVLLATGANPYATEVLHSVCKPCHGYLTLLEQRTA